MFKDRDFFACICKFKPYRTGIEVDATGCPVIEEITADLVLEGVNFRSGSAELTPGSLGILDDVAASLNAWPDVIFEIREGPKVLLQGDAQMITFKTRPGAIYILGPAEHPLSLLRAAYGLARES